MVVQSTRAGFVPARPVPGAAAAATDPLDEARRRIDEAVARLRGQPVTPQRFREFEDALHALSMEACRQIVEEEANRLEPDDKAAVPGKVRLGRETYRVNKKTPARVATRFGAIVLRSFYYLSAEAGEPGVHPLRLRLGVGAGLATPALLERVARMAVDQSQAEVRAWLRREHGLAWSAARLRAALAGFRRGVAPWTAGLQQARLRDWLARAERSRGRHRPVLSVGRDGVMVPMRSGAYQEAATATVAVYDRGRRRLGTVYLGQMPEEKQATLSRELTALLTAVLAAWTGPAPRLVYVTDKGAAPDDYYRRVLRPMRHPRDGRRLAWEWVLDFYHVCGHVGTMADALFGPETPAAAQWFAKMRRWLRDRPQGVAQVLRSATQLVDRRTMTRAQRDGFWRAYRHLRRHRRWMDYHGCRRRGLPIGSGVTEAACKTVFAQRFKRSGMRWRRDGGQVILDLRVLRLSGVWDEAVAADLAARELPEPAATGSHHGPASHAVRIAA